MSPAEARAALVVAECRRDWETVKAHLARARAAEASQGPAPAALIALSLDHAYQAFEAILVCLERAAGLPERAGASWHAALLADAAIAIPGLRPPSFPPKHRSTGMRCYGFGTSCATPTSSSSTRALSAFEVPPAVPVSAPSAPATE